MSRIYSVPGIFGGEDYYDETGKKVGYSVPGLFGGHGSKSVYVLSRYLKDLREEEAIAINCHMGFSRGAENATSISEAFCYSPLARIIHVADEAATFKLDRGAPEA